MTAPALPAGLSEIAGLYDVILCDVWGVIHNGRRSFAGANEALSRFQVEQGPVVLISNAPRPSVDVHGQLDMLGVPRTAWSRFVSSGDATRDLLAHRAPGPAWAIGPERDAPLYRDLGLAFAGPEDAAFISITGPYDDEVDTPEDYRGRFETAIARGLVMICANPDLVVQRGTDLIYCAGALAQLYERMGGEVIMAGKPYPAIYDLALAEAQDLLGRPLDRARVLCVGDGMPTDVRGANAQGLDLLFIANGIHGADAVGADGRLIAAGVDRLLAEHGSHARWAMPDLTW